MFGFTFKYKKINDLVSNDDFFYVLQIKFSTRLNTFSYVFFRFK